MEERGKQKERKQRKWRGEVTLQDNCIPKITRSGESILPGFKLHACGQTKVVRTTIELLEATGRGLGVTAS